MNMTDRGLAALIRHEGIVPAPYLDVRDVWTFGIGHTGAAGDPNPSDMKRGMPADLDQGIREAFDTFRADIARYERDVRNAIAVPVEPHEFDALVSFHYNTGAIHSARLTRLLNAGLRDASAEAFMGWLKPGAIRPRREAERDLFRHGRYPEGTIPVWPVDASGRVSFARAARLLSEDEALELLKPQSKSVGLLARLCIFLSSLIKRS